MKEILESCWCCWECGKKYMDEMGYKIPEDSVSTFHHGECCCCREMTSVTNERYYKYLYYWRNPEKGVMDRSNTK